MMPADEVRRMSVRSIETLPKHMEVREFPLNIRSVKIADTK